MGNQSPGSEQRPKTPGQQGGDSPGSKDRNRPGQMEQAGRNDQPGGAKRTDQPKGSDTGQDKENDRGKSGAQRPD
jgi:hypothetical protein